MITTSWWTGKKHSPESIEKIRQAKLGIKASEESRRKMSEAGKKRVHQKQSLETIEKMSLNSTGKHPSAETRKKMSEARKGKPCPWKGIKWSEDRKKRFSELMKSKIRTPEHNRKISEGQRGNKRGTSWSKGRIFPETQGSNHSAWVGGDRRYWKRIVMERDSYTCWECGFSDKEIMEVHHIKPVCLNPELKRDPANMITLCPNCHRRKTLRDKKLISKNRMLKYKVTHGMNIFYAEMTASL